MFGIFNMFGNYRALAEARKRIAEVRSSGSHWLYLLNLARLPAELTDLPKLRQLSLLDCSLSSIALLAQLPELESLCLARTPVADITPLAKLPKLRKLELLETKVHDLSPLAGLKNLQTLQVRAESVDLAPLAHLRGLLHLSLGGSTFLRNFNAIGELASLVSLGLSAKNISGIGPLKGMADLSSLYLGGTSVSDLRPLSGLGNLDSLDLSETAVTDIVQIKIAKTVHSAQRP